MTRLAAPTHPMPTPSPRVPSLSELVERVHPNWLLPGITTFGWNMKRGAIVGMRFGSPSGHVLITGHDEEQRAELVRVMLAGASLHNPTKCYQHVLVGSAFMPLASFPHTWGNVVRNMDEAARALVWLANEAERRIRMRIAEPVVVVAIHKLDRLLERGGDDVERPIRHLLRRGREARFVLLATAAGERGDVLEQFQTWVRATDGAGAWELGKARHIVGWTPVEFVTAVMDAEEINELLW